VRRCCGVPSLGWKFADLEKCDQLGFERGTGKTKKGGSEEKNYPINVSLCSFFVYLVFWEVQFNLFR
jgi:hypothetical protein